VTKALVLSGAVYSIFCILAYIGLLGKIPQLPAFIKAKSFTPEGGYLPSMIFLVAILPLAVAGVASIKELRTRIVSLLAALVIVAGLILSIYQIIPGRPSAPKFPSTQISWEISIDALKVSPFLGVGPGNYMTAFNRYRPIAYNATDLWAIRFSTASDFLFTLFTETGLIGLIGMILLVWIFIKDSKKQLKENKLVNWGLESIAPLLSFALIILLFLIFPATVFVIVLMFILLALAAKTHPASSVNLMMQRVKEGAVEANSFSKFPALIIFVPVIALVIYLGYLSTNILRGEYYYKTALEALLANDAQGTFNNMRQAVLINPRVDRYHATFSRINLILADATARKKDLTDADRTTITQLIQASIAEAKNNVVLNTLRAQNWEVLGSTYQSIIPLANGADGFAAQAYNQAIALDPINPQTRITLGGLYYGAKNYETATRVFELAVTSKPDLANGHFNLAYSYNQQGKIDQAIQQMSLVLGIVKPDSNDYQVAKKALEDFQAKKKTVAEASSANLIPPAVPTPALKPKVELPEGSEPPAAPVTETPTPTPTPGQ
jgi:tetratricopeptide (TPR) repeat protein